MAESHTDGEPVTLTEVVELAHRHLRLDAVGIVEVRGELGVIRAWAGKGALAVGAEVPIRDSYWA